MKEFNNWFTISFSFMGKTFERTISIKKIHTPDDNDKFREWDYMTDINIGEDNYDIVVYGTYDDDGNIRTSGVCYVDGQEVVPTFGIEVLDNNDDLVAFIDDIDIIDGD